jgi:excisionase family DNA binding protein
MQASTRSQGSIAPAEVESSVFTPHVKKYHRIREDAARLGVSLRTYATWLAERRIPHFKVGRCVLVDPVAVDEALRKFRVGPSTERKRRAIRINPELPA